MIPIVHPPLGTEENAVTLRVLAFGQLAQGAQVDGALVVSFGTSCLSCYAAKNIATGEGGMAATDSAGFSGSAPHYQLATLQGPYYRKYIDTSRFIDTSETTRGKRSDADARPSVAQKAALHVLSFLPHTMSSEEGPFVDKALELGT